jgi:PAS domain-containing protein
VIALPVAWIGFVLDFVARERAVVRRATSRLGIVAGLILLTAWTNEWHELFWGPLTLDPLERSIRSRRAGPASISTSPTPTACSWPVWPFWSRRRFSRRTLYRKRTVILALAVVLPWLGNVIFVARRETAGSIDATPFLFTCTAVIAAVAVFRYRVLEPIPTLLDARIEVIGDGCLLVDRSLRIADLNRAAEAIIRRDRAAAAGERIERLLPDWPANVDTEVRQDLTLAAPEGTRTYDVRITPIRSAGERVTGYVVLLRDVTDHRLAEAALRDSELRYRGLVENARDLICTCDLEGHIRAVNQAGLDLTGYTSQELVGRKLFDPGSSEAAVVTRDGRTIALELASWPEYRDGVPIAIQAIGRDVTERKRLEEELRQAQKMESVGKLAGGIAHDFNNLLTAIIGYAALAEAEQVPGTPLHEWIEQIRRSGEQAATLTSQLLAFGRRQVLRPVDLDLERRGGRHPEDAAAPDRRADRGWWCSWRRICRECGRIGRRSNR